MGRVVRSVVGVLIGALACGGLIFLVEMISAAVYPPPQGLDANDREAMVEYMASLPVAAFIFVLGAWGIGTFCGSFLTAYIAGRRHLVHALGLAGGFLVFALIIMAWLPHPPWFIVPGILVFPVAGLFGGILAAWKQRPKKK